LDSATPKPIQSWNSRSAVMGLSEIRTFFIAHAQKRA
jgi:hypothetical protein